MATITAAMALEARRTQPVKPSTPQNSTTQKTTSFAIPFLRSIVINLGKAIAAIAVTVVVVAAFKTLPLLAALALLVSVVASPYLVYKLNNYYQKKELMTQISAHNNEDLNTALQNLSPTSSYYGTKKSKDYRTLENLKALLDQRVLDNTKQAPSLAMAFTTLSNNGLLDKENREILLNNLDAPLAASSALVTLNRLGPQNQTVTFEQLKGLSDDLAVSFVHLNRAGILNPANRDTLINNQKHAIPLKDGIELLSSKEKLTQTTFDLLIANPDHAKSYAEGLLKGLPSDHDSKEKRGKIRFENGVRTEIAPEQIRLNV